MNDATISLIQQLAEQLGTTTGHVMTVLTHGEIVSGIVSLSILLLGWLLFIVGTYFVFRGKFYSWLSVKDAEWALAIRIMIGIIYVLATAITMLWGSSALFALCAPEAAALRDLVRLIAQ